MSGGPPCQPRQLRTLRSFPVIRQATLFEIADLLAQHKTETIPKKLQELLDLVAAQPADFQMHWSWAGTVHFIQTDDRLAPVRGWLLSFLEALQGQDRAALLAGIRTAASSFAAVAKR